MAAWGTNKLAYMHACNRKRSIYSNRTVNYIDLPTALLEYIDLVQQNKANP